MRQKFIYWIFQTILLVLVIVLFWILLHSETKNIPDADREDEYKTVLKKSSEYNIVDYNILIKQIEDMYSIALPQNISNVTAGETLPYWDGGPSFVLKFEMRSDDWEDLYDIGGISSLMEYEERLDFRLKAGRYPAWFKVPIIKGRIFRIRVKREDMPNTVFPIEVYVDTSNEEKVIVYMSGVL